MSSNWFILQEVPFTESVCYLGAGKWKFESYDCLALTTLKGNFSTKKLIEWVCDRDGDDASPTNLKADSGDQSDETQEHPSLGPRASRLLEIADSVGAGLCSRRLRGINDGTWPPIPRIMEITGVTVRVIWHGISHSVFSARTSQGAAYVYPPQPNNMSKLVLMNSSSMDQGWIVPLSPKCLRQMKRYETELGHADA